MISDETTSPLLLHRYRVDAQWDEDDITVVMRAYDTQRQRDVLIQTMRPDAQLHEAGAVRALREQFANETEAGARLGARQEIVAVFDLASGADDVPYLILEYLPGGTLAERLRQGTAVPLPEAVVITRDVAHALEAAHEAGIVHGDVRPAHVFLTANGHAKLGGFGNAQIADSARPAASAPPRSLSVDAARYLAPEQEQGQVTGNTGRASDQYRLGLIFFEMLIGVPFRELEPAAAWARAAWQSPAVFACLRRMMMDTPPERYPSMAAVIAALDRITLPRMPGDSPIVAPVIAPLREPPVSPPSAAPELEAPPRQSVASPSAPLPAELLEAIVETHSSPRAPASVLAVADSAPADRPRRGQFARMGAALLVLLILIGALFVVRGTAGRSGARPAATASIPSAATTVPFVPTPSITIVAIAPVIPTSSVAIATVTPLPIASAPVVSPASSVGTSNVTATDARSVAVSSPGMTAQPAPGGVMASPPAATLTPALGPTTTPAPIVPPMAPMPTPPPVPPAPTQVAPTATPVPPPVTPAPTPLPPPTPTPPPPMPTATSLPTPEPPTATPQPPMLGVQSAGTTNQPLPAIAPEDSVVLFTAGQEVFGWVNYGAAVVGQDSFDAAVIAGGTVITTRHVPLTQPQGFAVFSLGQIPAGQYLLQVSYRGNTVRESSFTVSAPGAQPRAVPAATRAAAVAVPAATLRDAMASVQ